MKYILACNTCIYSCYQLTLAVLSAKYENANSRLLLSFLACLPLVLGICYAHIVSLYAVILSFVLCYVNTKLNETLISNCLYFFLLFVFFLDKYTSQLSIEKFNRKIVPLAYSLNTIKIACVRLSNLTLNKNMISLIAALIFTINFPIMIWRRKLSSHATKFSESFDYYHRTRYILPVALTLASALSCFVSLNLAQSYHTDFQYIFHPYTIVVGAGFLIVSKVILSFKNKSWIPFTISALFCISSFFQIWFSEFSQVIDYVYIYYLSLIHLIVVPFCELPLVYANRFRLVFRTFQFSMFSLSFSLKFSNMDTNILYSFIGLSIILPVLGLYKFNEVHQSDKDKEQCFNESETNHV